MVCLIVRNLLCSLWSPDFRYFITKTRLYNFDPLKPHFYIVKQGFKGVYIIFFFLFLLKTNCGHSLEPPRQGGSSEYPQSMFWAEIWKISIFFFLSENFQFLVVKVSVYLNRHVFVMSCRVCKATSKANIVTKIVKILLSTVTPTGSLVKTFNKWNTCNKTSEESCKLWYWRIF